MKLAKEEKLKKLKEVTTSSPSPSRLKKFVTLEKRRLLKQVKKQRSQLDLEDRNKQILETLSQPRNIFKHFGVKDKRRLGSNFRLPFVEALETLDGFSKYKDFTKFLDGSPENVLKKCEIVLEELQKVMMKESTERIYGVQRLKAAYLYGRDQMLKGINEVQFKQEVGIPIKMQKNKLGAKFLEALQLKKSPQTKVVKQQQRKPMKTKN